MSRPVCLVVIPPGKEPVYEELLLPAVREAELEPLVASDICIETFLLAHCAIVDVSHAGPDLYYKLGAREATRPSSTVTVYAEGHRRPFEAAGIEAVPYRLAANGHPAELEKTRETLVKRLHRAGRAEAANRLIQLLDGPSPDAIARTKTDVFRDQVAYSPERKRQLAAARRQGVEAVRAVYNDIGPLADAESGVVIDLFLSYRAVRGWTEMIALVEEMSPPLRSTILVEEQLAFALNRTGESGRAEALLRSILHRHGPSSETCSLLGRVYKDRWQAAVDAGDPAAPALLDQAIEAYQQGFEADWRDAFPGINAITLMEVRQPPMPERRKLMPLVRYAAERRIAAGEPDYWDHATLLEVAVLEADEAAASRALAYAVLILREPWEAEATLRNLRLISAARKERGPTEPWITDVEQALEAIANLTAQSPFSA